MFRGLFTLSLVIVGVSDMMFTIEYVGSRWLCFGRCCLGAFVMVVVADLLCVCWVLLVSFMLIVLDMRCCVLHV